MKNFFLFDRPNVQIIQRIWTQEVEVVVYNLQNLLLYQRDPKMIETVQRPLVSRMSADIIILTFVKMVVDLEHIFVMFNIKESIMIEHFKRIGHLMVTDQSIRETQIKIQYDVHQMMTLFYDQVILFVILKPMTMNRCEGIDKDHLVRSILFAVVFM